MLLLPLLLSLLPLLLSLALAQEDPLLVQTADGPVRGGIRLTDAGEPFHSFQGIPFAAPPVGNLRFAPPQPVLPWEEELDVSSTAYIKCIQYGFMTDTGVQEVSGSEDCLYLNVYVPENITTPLPVMMWIFGGYFQAGSNQWTEYGPIPWMDKEVIIVTPNHRLGPFGFTSLGIPEAPGNQGIRDLVAALQWINNNIAAFGGDPGSVTVFGESSGSWAVSYLHMTPYANGLFHRAILQSGTLFNPYWLWRTEEDAVNLSDMVADVFGCPYLEPQEKLSCLQALSVSDLESSINWGSPATWQIQKIQRPSGVVDGDFIPDLPHHLLERGEYNHVDIMIGFTKDEALMQTINFATNAGLLLVAGLGWNEVFGPMFLFGRFGEDIIEQDLELTKIITEWYLAPHGAPINFNMNHFQNITDMISDAYIWSGSHHHAKGAAMHGDNVFQYLFQFKGTYGYMNAITGDNTEYGVCHSDELYYFWKPYWSKAVVQFTPEEKVVSDNLLTLWSNFAKYGDPTPPEFEGPVEWGQVTPDLHQYLVIDTDLEMDCSAEYMARMGLWEEVYIYPEGNTLPPYPEGYPGN